MSGVTSGVLLIPEQEPAKAAGPEIGPALGYSGGQQAAVEGNAPTAAVEVRCSLVGRLEVGAERGTWNLRYDPEPGSNRPGDVVMLVAPQPLCGCHEGWQARVDGYRTSFGREQAFQVERLVVIPPPQARPTAPAAVQWQPPVPTAKRFSLVGRLEAGVEGGSWNLRYDPDLQTNRPGGMVKLIAPRPLSGYREGQEVWVEGCVTQVGWETALQVEQMAVVPLHGVNPFPAPAR
jgi:hypothetical protein